MEMSAEKSLMLTSNTDNTSADMTTKGQKFAEVDAFEYLGCTITMDGGLIVEIKMRLALAATAMAKLCRPWKSRDINFPTKLKLLRAIVLSVPLFGFEGWTLTAEMEKTTQAFEMKCF